MKCPNCDFIERDEAFGKPATCPSCGAIYEKALRMKALREQQEAARKKKAEADAEKSRLEAEKAKKEAARIEAVRAQHLARQAEKANQYLPKHIQERMEARVSGGAKQENTSPVGVIEHMTQGVAESRAQAARDEERWHERSVVISDIQVPFLSIVVLMFKIFLAAIPAGIAVYIVYTILIAIVGPIL